MADDDARASGPARGRTRTIVAGSDPGPLRPAPLRQVSVGFWLPEQAFGASLEVDSLLDEPRMTYEPGDVNVLTLAPVRSADVTLRYTWGREGRKFAMEAHGTVPFAVTDMATIERWMSATASRCHAYRLLVRDAADRVMWAAAEGEAETLPEDDERIAGQMVLTRIATAVTGPDETWPCGMVELDEEVSTSPKRFRFVDSFTQRRLGTLSLVAYPDSNELLETYEVDEKAVGVTPEDLIFWHRQVGMRELLFDDARVAYTYLLSGLEPPEYLSRVTGPGDRNGR